MSVDTAALNAPAVAAPRAVDAWRRDRRFFTGMALAILMTVCVHPAYWWGGGLLLGSQIGRLALSGTSAWLAFATWLTR